MLILDQAEYAKIEPLMEGIPFNTYFAQAVQQKRAGGTVFVDNLKSPQACLIFHPYGMLLLCGRSDNQDFNREIADFMLNTRYDHALWLQVYPPDWSRTFEHLLAGRLKPYPQGKSYAEAENEFKQLNRKNVVECTRVNFKFDTDLFLKSSRPQAAKGLTIGRMGKSQFQNFNGSVIAKYFWNSYEDFAAQGAGFSVTRGETVLSACFTAFVIGDIYEIGIETNPDHRGQGYARLAARAFIDYCLENKLEPMWGCRKENLGSYRLAQQLGFRPVGEQPYYGLVDNSR